MILFSSSLGFRGYPTVFKYRVTNFTRLKHSFEPNKIASLFLGLDNFFKRESEGENHSNNSQAKLTAINKAF